MDHPRRRAVAIDDLPAVQRLILQLGYELTAAETEARFRAVMSAKGHVIFAAELGGRTVGLLHLFARPALDKPPEVLARPRRPAKGWLVQTHRGRSPGRSTCFCAR